MHAAESDSRQAQIREALKAELVAGYDSLIDKLQAELAAKTSVELEFVRERVALHTIIEELQSTFRREYASIQENVMKIQSDFDGERQRLTDELRKLHEDRAKCECVVLRAQLAKADERGAKEKHANEGKVKVLTDRVSEQRLQVDAAEEKIRLQRIEEHSMQLEVAAPGLESIKRVTILIF